MRRIIYTATMSILLLLMHPSSGSAQDTLPAFTVKEINGKTIVGWNNPDKELKQLIIQQSADSLKAFHSIMSMPDPTSFSNGYLVKSTDSIRYFYRIFYVKLNGQYFFTKAKKATKEIPPPPPPQPPKPQPVIQPITQPVANPSAKSSPQKETKADVKKQPTKKNTPPPIFETKSLPPITETEKEVVQEAVNYIEEEVNSKKYERVQLNIPVSKIEDIEKISKFIKKDSVATENMFQPSAFIYINPSGNLMLILPNPEKKHFSFFVYKEDGALLFNMKNIKESKLLIDRSNFMSSGWFNYELYDGQKPKEKSKFFIPPENR
jgi:hypothetical protein